MYPSTSYGIELWGFGYSMYELNAFVNLHVELALHNIKKDDKINTNN